MNRTRGLLLVALLLTVVGAGAVLADGGVTFTNVAADGGVGINYERTPSPRLATVQAIYDMGVVPNPDLLTTSRVASAQKARGNPGIALLDYDNDGDVDIYVTNGPGTPNSLYTNLLVETGELNFIDDGVAAGVAATAQDSGGTCHGDIDNDGDKDLYVVGAGEANILFENQGDGTFVDITDAAGVAGGDRWASACTFGDFDGDGLLDLAVANTYDNWNHRTPNFAANFEPLPHYPLYQHNQLFMNGGGNVFADMSAANGLENVFNMAGPGLSGASYTWAVAAVDYNLDGDVDIFFLDTQGVLPHNPAENRGYIRLYDNDGSGVFTERTVESGLAALGIGAWMGSDFGDLNCDGFMDFFATDLGYYMTGNPLDASGWFFGGPGGTFSDPGVGDLITTPFGWGTSMFDYDNDGDTDIIYHGSIDILSGAIADNPGVLLRNTGQCSGVFSWDAPAIQTDHRLRNVEGVAVGDVNDDGFEDILSAASFRIQPLAPFFLPIVNTLLPPSGSPFDAVAFIQASFEPFSMPGFWVYTNPTYPNGDLSIELNSADNGNNWLDVTLRGSKDTLANGVVNRDGIGGVITLRTPQKGYTAMRPVIGGSSLGSEDDQTAHFGLGDERRGLVEVMWPGGVRNRLYTVRLREHVTFPEIPCSFAADWSDVLEYAVCVDDALQGLSDAGVVNETQHFRYLVSAIRAYFDFRLLPNG